jgi:hypothetical protein
MAMRWSSQYIVNIDDTNQFESKTEIKLMAWKRAVCYARKTHENPVRRGAHAGAGYPPKSARRSRKLLSEHELSNAIYRFVLSSWETLSYENKLQLGFDPAPGSVGERQGLMYLAGLFKEFSEASFERALDARQRRLSSFGGGNANPHSNAQ